ncbi:MAG TPA: hypothetical protein VLR52_04560, partial [Bacteroidales bacterium]|nr:hypothetical protein [Bacteroidales bacterium]
MKRNRYYILAVIILALIAIALLLTNPKTTFRGTDSNFAVEDTSIVTKIFMSDKNNNTLTLERKDAGNWIVDHQYAAQKFNIQMLLSTMLQLEVKSPVAKAARTNIIKDMATNAVKVEIYQMKYRINLFNKIRLLPREQLSKVYYVGSATQDNQGTFMVMENSSEPYVVYLPGLRGFVSTRFTPIQKYWRDYTMFRKNIPEIVSVRMEFPQDPASSFQVNNNRMRNIILVSLIDGVPVPHYDTLKMMNFLSSFRNLNFEAVLNDMDKHRKDSIISSIPYCVISLTDTSNKVTSIKSYRKGAAPGETDDMGKPLPYDLDRLYVLVNDG